MALRLDISVEFHTLLADFYVYTFQPVGWKRRLSMNRVLILCAVITCFVLVNPYTESDDYFGMDYYKQADLQCLTHPDLFSKWACCKGKKKEVAEADTAPPASENNGMEEREADPLEWKPLPAKLVYFDYDKSLLKPEGKAAIQRNVQFLKAHPNARILIEGHCDERGTDEYNLALGERRANAIVKYMGELGISASRVTTKSWGEERPVALGHSEESWWQNRRGEMFFSEE